MKRAALGIVVASLGFVSAGCYHPKAIDSYGGMFRQETPPGKGDPYGFGGIAEASGGLAARQSQSTDNVSSDPLKATETGKAGRIDEPRTTSPGGLAGYPTKVSGNMHPIRISDRSPNWGVADAPR